MIYLDYNATTPTDKRVVKAMLPFFSELYANPASNHVEGKRVKKALDNARSQVSDLLGGEPNEIIFTSGATEAINLAIKGVAYANRNKGNHIVTVSTEHKAVLDTCAFLETQGFEVSYLPVEQSGVLDLNTFRDAFRQDTILCATMFVNNETGVIHPVKQLVEITHGNGAVFVCDATQAVGKIPVDMVELDIDLLAFSGHKFYGPKGIGALFCKRGITLQGQIHGGGHERNRRSGTLNVPLIVGLGEACALAKQEMEELENHVSKLRTYFEEEVLKLPGVRINAKETSRLFNVSNVLFKGIEADILIANLKDVMVSTGSACTSALIEPSHVLTAMGLTEDEANSCLRFSFGRQNSLEEVITVVDKIEQLSKSMA